MLSKKNMQLFMAGFFGLVYFFAKNSASISLLSSVRVLGRRLGSYTRLREAASAAASAAFAAAVRAAAEEAAALAASASPCSS